MNRCTWLVLFFVPVLFVGCGNDGKIKTEYVDGIVTMNGEPLVLANVTFYPVDEAKGREAYGSTDESGKYTLTTDGGREEGGALPGEYIVTVSKRDVPKLEPTGDPDPNKPVKPIKVQQAPLMTPEKYNKKDSTDLKATVKEGDNKLDFELVGKKK